LKRKVICPLRCGKNHYVVFVDGTSNKTVASEHKSQSWWCDALTLCPRVTQNPKSFAWTNFSKIPVRCCQRYDYQAGFFGFWCER
jgi:hypothetical protein